ARRDVARIDDHALLDPVADLAADLVGAVERVHHASEDLLARRGLARLALAHDRRTLPGSALENQLLQPVAAELGELLAAADGLAGDEHHRQAEALRVAPHRRLRGRVVLEA